MLRIADSRTGRLVEIPAAPHRHLLRVCVRLDPAGEAGTAPPTLDPRGPLVGDLLARVAELQGLQSHTVLVVPDPAPSSPSSRGSARESARERNTAALGRALSALGIHPPAVTGAPPATDALCAAADVHVHADNGALAGALPEPPGAALIEMSEGGALPLRLLDAAPSDGLLPGSGPPHDPLAVRLWLLRRPYAAPAAPDDAGLDDARRTLARWRRQVAAWAREPSRPVPAEVLREAQNALSEDLDVPAVLGLLEGLADRGDVPAGARFETFALLDRVLGLDLAREVGG
ncbi:hypothetical protein [Streptomyces sp. NPDC048577]|uniref:hypothetical protein n=1 Tax=Streptomyces sp. NPDC048577 TaxID=3157209 RepID=UPI00343814F6